MRRPRPSIATAAISLAILAACAGANGVAEAELVPHQAIYNLKLTDVSGMSNFNGITGAAVSQIERTCEGWKVSEQLVMSMTTNAGGAIDREMVYQATESLDGRYFKFHSTSTTNGTTEDFKGSAKVKPNGTSEAEFITPSPFEMPLPDGAKFYVSMTKWLVDLVKSGARSGQTVVFDGSDDQGPQQVTAFILPDRGAHEGIKGDPALLQSKGWEVRLAYFRLKGQSSQPEFEIALRLLENGIVTRFNLIFDDMTIRQTLEDVLPAKDERCN